MDHERDEHPVVVLAQVRLDLLGRPVVRRRSHVEVAPQAAVERAGGLSSAPPNARRKTGVHSIASGSSARPSRSRSRQKASTRASSARQKLEEPVGCLVPLGDRVERGPHEGPRRSAGGLTGVEPGPELPCQADHLGTDGVELAPRPTPPARQALISTRSVWRSFAAKRSWPEAALALRRGEDDVAEVGRERLEGGLGCGGGRLQAGPHGRQLALLVGVGGSGEGLPAEVADPRELGEGDLRVQAAAPAGPDCRRAARGPPPGRPGSPRSALPPRPGARPAGRTRGRAGGGSRRPAGRPRRVDPRPRRGARSRRTGTPPARRGRCRGRWPGRESGRSAGSAANASVQRSTRATSACEPASVWSGHSPSWSWLPTHVAKTGLARNRSAKRPWTSSSKVVTGGSGVGGRLATRGG